MRPWRWALSGALIALLAYAAGHVDWHATAHALSRASPALIAAALLLNAMSLLLRGARWWIFLRPAGAPSLALAVRGAVVGSGFNNLLIANGGDAARAVLVARETGIPATSVVATLALDRMFDPLCFVLLLFGATFAVPLPATLASSRVIAGLAILAAFTGLVALGRASKCQRFGFVHEVTGWRERIGRFRRNLGCLATRRRLAAALLCSIGVWTLQIAEYAAVADAVGLRLPVSGSIAAMILINAGLVLRASPGGVGYFQFAYAVAVSHFGIAADAAVATAVLIQLVEILPVTLAALVLAPRMLSPRRRKRPVGIARPCSARAL